MQARLKGLACRENPFQTLIEALAARSDEDRSWLAFHRMKSVTTLTYRDAWRLAQGWASAFAAHGVRSGDRVAILQPNSTDFVGSFFGALGLGATPVPLPFPVVSLAAMQLPLGAMAILRHAKVTALAAPAAVSDVGISVVTSPIDRRFDFLVSTEVPAFIQFTSGSTSSPRGVVISQQAAVASAVAMSDALALTSSDVGVSWLPFFHDMGLVGVLLSSLVTGFTVHTIQPGDFLLHPSRWIELMSAVSATLTVAPNFGYELVARRMRTVPAHFHLSSLRAALNGSEPVLRQTIDRFEELLAPAGLRRGVILPVYGLAENTLGVSFQMQAQRDVDWVQGVRSIPSAGQPLPGTEVSIVNDSGEILTQGEIGEIAVSGPSVMSGYLFDEEATRRTLRDGWLRTGDRGVISNGALYITGREKELVIKAGRKFHPTDIERVVSEVVDTPPNGVAAFSVLHDDARGEELVVVVELRRQIHGDVQSMIRGKISEALGVMTDRIELVGAGELPRTTSGKLRRRECVARFGVQH